MLNALKFFIPEIHHIPAIVKFRQDFIKKHPVLRHGTSELNAFTDEGLVGWVNYTKTPSGTNLFGYEKVSDSTYLAMIDNEIVGIFSIRHTLNDFLLQQGGHVGYSTHPNFEGKGIASQMLAFSIKTLNEMGVTKVLVTCDDTNIGSQRVIEKNGGVLENIIPINDGEPLMLRRYWIDSSH